MAFIPETLETTEGVAPPNGVEEPAVVAPVEEAIARVDASVEALMGLLSGSTESKPVVEEPAPVVDEVIAEEPVAQTAADEARFEEAPVDEPPLEDAIARVDASVDALMRLLPGTVEVEPIEVPAAEPPAEVATDEAVAEAEPTPAPDTEAEIAKTRRGWRAAKRARVEAELNVFAAEIEADDPIAAEDTVEPLEVARVAGAAPEPEPEVAGVPQVTP